MKTGWDIVEVTWEDSALAEGWSDALVKTQKDLVSWGALVHDDDAGIILLFGFDLDEESTASYMSSTFIPRSAIREVTTLIPKPERVEKLAEEIAAGIRDVPSGETHDWVKAKLHAFLTPAPSGPGGE